MSLRQQRVQPWHKRQLRLCAHPDCPGNPSTRPAISPRRAADCLPPSRFRRGARPKSPTMNPTAPALPRSNPDAHPGATSADKAQRHPSGCRAAMRAGPQDRREPQTDAACSNSPHGSDIRGPWAHRRRLHTSWQRPAQTRCRLPVAGARPAESCSAFRAPHCRGSPPSEKRPVPSMRRRPWNAARSLRSARLPGSNTAPVQTLPTLPRLRQRHIQAEASLLLRISRLDPEDDRSRLEPPIRQSPPGSTLTPRFQAGSHSAAGTVAGSQSAKKVSP